MDYPATVSRLARLAEDVCLVEVAAGQDLPGFSAGAHADLGLPNGMRRSYSLIGDAGDARIYRFAIGRDPAGRGASRFIHDELRVGDRVSVSAPRNAFPLHPAAPYHLFIAGGIGITPIRAMIETLTRLGDDRWRLVYAGRSRTRMAFLDELSALGRIDVHADDECGGKVLDLAAIIAAAPATAHLYCCGPAPMLAAFETATAGRAPGSVHLERFGAAPAASGDTAVTVRLARSGRVFEVPAGETILDHLLDAGVNVGFSCMSGMCGSCRVVVLEGIPDHRDEVLSPAERAANDRLMICCSRARTPVLVLDL